MYDVTAIGELLIDFTCVSTDPDGFPALEAHPGGAPANFLAALAATGAKTALIAAVGADAFGRMLTRAVSAAGVDTRAVRETGAAFTTLAFVTLDEAGEREFSFARKPGADTRITEGELARDVIAASRVFHVGSLSLTDEPARSATLAALEAAREAGCTLSYDPNYRANLWPSVEAAVEQMRAVVPQMDLMKLSDEECALLTGFDDPESAAAALLAQGPKVVAVTLGGSGAYVRTADGGAEVAGFPAEAVDATGAGDSFWGGFLAGFCESGKAAGEVTVEDAAGFARLGNAVASLCVRKRGATPAMPERADVEALLGA